MPGVLSVAQGDQQHFWSTEAGLIPHLAEWFKDLVLPQQLQLGSDPWPGNSLCCRVAKKRKKKC